MNNDEKHPWDELRLREFIFFMFLSGGVIGIILMIIGISIF